MDLTKELQKIGLNEKESKIYLGALELGKSSVQNIAVKSGVNRATTYVILDALIEKGLCSKQEKGKKTFYFAVAPEQLESIFDAQKRDITEKQKLFKKLLPDLRVIHNEKEDKPIIKFFEGRQGVINSTVENYKRKAKGVSENEPLRIIYNLDLIKDIFTEDELKKFREERIKHKVKTKSIYSSDKFIRKSNWSGTRIQIPAKDHHIGAEFDIYKNSVEITTFGKRLATVVIEDKEVAKTMKTIFDLAWEAAEKKYGLK
jgi:HTH-type transcriptional regulator, sugar sensing transcriptional regulator